MKKREKLLKRWDYISKLETGSRLINLKNAKLIASYLHFLKNY